MTLRIHGTVVAIEGRGVLIRGRPGAGKSDLALRLIDRGAKLVSDDAVILRRLRSEIRCDPIVGFEGLIEARGLGIVRVPDVPSAPLRLIISLNSRPERMPVSPRHRLRRYAVPQVTVDPNSHSAPIHVELALNGAVLPIE